MRRYWLLAALPFALAACSNSDNDAAAAGDTLAATMPAAMDTGAMAPMPADTAALSDGEIAMILSVSDSAEINPSQLAQQKAQNAQVKQFAQMMVQDHGMLEDSLHALLQQQSITPAPSAMAQQLQGQAQMMMQQLQGLSGAAFDSAYVAAMVKSHQDALNAIDNKLIPAAQNAQLKSALQQKVRPVVADHLQKIQQIQSSMGS